MNLLVITGDKRFGPGHPRYELQKEVVESLHVVYWGRGRYLPVVPDTRIDIVTVQDPFWRGVYAWLVARRIGARFNVQVHADLTGQSFVRRMIASAVLRRADSIRVVSKKIESQISHIGVRARISVLPVFVDISQFRTVIHQPHYSKTILWIGRFEEEKNPMGAIEIYKDVYSHMPHTRMVLLGDGHMKAWLEEAAKGLPVEFPGWQDPLAYLSTADLVLCTSWHESFGASIIEALAAGVAVVAPDVGIAREAGAIVVPRNELGNKVRAVLTEGTMGTLTMPMPTSQEWKKLWLETL